MAGDWIKMRSNLWDDPRVSRLVDLTDSSEAAVVGALYWLWAAADQHTETGTMPGLSLRQIDRKTGIQGFGEALCDIGWLADHPEGVRIVNFEEHNGESAKRRCADAKRKASVRKESAECPQESGQKTENLGEVAELEKEKEKEKDLKHIATEKPPKQKPSPSPDDLAVARTILEGVRSIVPNHKPPDLDRWAETIRLMRERDNRSHTEIVEIFQWANRDHFWKANILSPDKLREKFDQLTAQRISRGGTHAQTGLSSSSHSNGRGSAVDRVEAAVAAERASRAAAGPRHDHGPVAGNGPHVRPQVDEQLRRNAGPRERVGEVLEGSFRRAD